MNRTIPLGCLMAIACVVAFVASSARAGDWPAYGHDAQRSHITDEKLTLPLDLSWRHHLAQKPAPAWPEPVKNLNRTDFDYAAQPVVAGGRVFVGSSADDTMRALDLRTGREQWRMTVGGPIRFAPHFAEGRLHFAADDGFVYAVDAATGALQWKFRAAPNDEMMLGNGRMISRWPCRSGVLVDRGVVYVTAGMWPAEGIFIYALDAGTGKVIWCNDTAGFVPVRVVGHETNTSLSGLAPQGWLLASDDKLVVTCGRGAPATLDRATGKLLRFGPGGTNGVGGSAAIIDGDAVYLYAKSFYSGLNIAGLKLGTLAIDPDRQLKRVQMPISGIPQPGVFLKGSDYSIYDSKTSFLVRDGTLTARSAFALARTREAGGAGGSLVLGLDDSVAIEGSVARRSASIRVALAGDSLAVFADVIDRKVTQDREKPWKGSCFEVYAVPAIEGAAGKKIGQVMIVPGAEGTGAIALVPAAEKPLVSDAVSVKTLATPTGYELSALIPLGLLGLDAKPQAAGARAGRQTIDLEFQVTATTEAGTLNRDTMFGSVLAYQDRSKYGRFVVRPAGLSNTTDGKTATKPTDTAGGKAAAAEHLITQRGVMKLDELKASLAGEPVLNLGVKDQAEGWRAAVNGKAYGLAIADGSLIVSTDKGELSCFVTGSASPNVTQLHDDHARIASQTPTSGHGKLSFNVVRRIKEARLDSGYALLLGDVGSTHLARMIAAETGLHVVVVVPDEQSMVASRADLINNSVLYGKRIHVVAVNRLEILPFPRYFASVVFAYGVKVGVDEQASVMLAPVASELYRVLRPAGGLMFLPMGVDKDVFAKAAGAATGESRDGGLGSEIVRGRLEGAWDWDSKPGEGDRLVRWPLRPIWFGGTGPATTHNRKFQGPVLTSANGRVFENGDSAITAVDAYNGAQWWSRPKPFEDRGGKAGSMLAADADHVYFTLGKAAFNGVASGCFVLDARSGQQTAIYAPWKPALSMRVGLGPVGGPGHDSIFTLIPQDAPPTAPELGATATAPSDDARAIGTLSVTADTAGITFVLVSKPPAKPTLQPEWQLHFDFRPLDQRWGLYDPGVWMYRVTPASPGKSKPIWRTANGTNHPPLKVEGSCDATGRAMTTVRLAWADVPAIKGWVGLSGKPPESLGFAAALEHRDPAIKAPVVRANLFCDELADGLNKGWLNLALSADSSSAAKTDAAMSKRPAIVKGLLEGSDKIDSGGLELEPPLPASKWKPRSPGVVASLVSQPRVHPLTGEKVERTWWGGDGCAPPVFSAQASIFRAANIGFYDFLDDSGMRTFGGVRTSCGNSMLASQGIWFVGNGGSGCECTYPFLSEIGLAPADRRLNEDWAVFAEWNVDTRVRQAALNFGAAGDRRDDKGTLWLGYPRPARGMVGLSLGPTSGSWSPIHGVWQQRKTDEATPVPITIETFPGGEPRRTNADRLPIADTDRPWLYGSNFTGIRKATVDLEQFAPIVAHRTDGAVEVDGKLADKTWNAKPQATLPATGSTVAVAFDDQNLYLACRRPNAFDRQGNPRKWNLSGGGAGALHWSDHWEIFLSDVRNQKVIHLGINASGTTLMGMTVGDEAEKVKLNLPVRIAQRVEVETGFVAEFAVPWTLLEAEGIDRQTLGINARIGDHPNVGEALVRLGYRSSSRCGNFVPTGLGVKPATPMRRFTLRLHFAELDEIPAGRRVFDVKVQDRTVISGLDITAVAGGPQRALVRTIDDVIASDKLEIEFVRLGAGDDASSLPILSALELNEVLAEVGATSQPGATQRLNPP